MREVRTEACPIVNKPSSAAWAGHQARRPGSVESLTPPDEGTVMATLLHRLGAFGARRRRTMILCWLIILAAVVGLGITSGGKL